MTGDQPFWKQVGVHTTAYVIAGMLFAVWAWTSGRLGALWDWTLSALGAIGTALLYSVPIPVSVLLLAIVALVFICRRAVARPRETMPAVSSQTAPPFTGSVQLNALDQRVLRELARANGTWVPFDVLAKRLNTSTVVLEPSIGHLYRYRFIDHEVDPLYGSRYLVTPIGCDFVIKQGYVDAEVPPPPIALC